MSGPWHYLAILRLQSPLDGGRKEVLLPFPSPWASLMRWVCREGEAPEKQRETPKCRGKNLEEIPKPGDIQTQRGVQRQK